MRGSIAHIGSLKQLQKRLTQQDAIQNAYWCMRSTPWSTSIICDKVDHGNTTSLCFASKNKYTDMFTKLPLFVTSMIAHGHGDESYALYSLDLQPRDCNHTVGSFARFPHNLETPLILTNQVLFDVPDGLLFTREYCMGKENVCTDWKPHQVIPYLLCHFHPFFMFNWIIVGRITNTNLSKLFSLC